MFDLAYVLGTLSTDQFLKEYKGKKAIYIPGSADRYPDLFGWDEINDILNLGRPSLEAIRLVYEKKPLENVELGRLFHWLTEGATLIINSAQQIDPMVEQLSNGLGKDMNSFVNINCYTSFPSKQGFDCHYDGHDVFIMQTTGDKLWKVFEPTRMFPLDIERKPKQEPPEDLKCYVECTLTPGDVLYIPRGHWHYALSQTPSVHLTVSQGPRSGIEFLHWINQQLLESDEFLRQDFPIVDIASLGGNREDDVFHQHMEKFRQHMQNVIDDPGMQESFNRFCMTRNPVRQHFQLPEIGILSDELSKDTAFKLATSQKALIRYDEEKHSAMVTVRGKVLDLNNVSKPLLEAIFFSANPVISGNTLMKVHSDWEGIKFLLQKLFEEGMLILDTE